MRARVCALLGAVLVMINLAALVPANAAQPDIYPGAQHAHQDLAEALQAAAATHRRVLLDFGGNWCTDCHVLDFYFHEPANQALLSKFVLVHINIGRMNENLDIAEGYHIPVRKGVPALAVLDEHGALLYSQGGGEFQDMRHMQSSSVNEFLTHWGAAPP